MEALSEKHDVLETKLDEACGELYEWHTSVTGAGACAWGAVTTILSRAGLGVCGESRGHASASEAALEAETNALFMFDVTLAD